MTSGNQSIPNTSLDDHLQAIGEIQTRLPAGQRAKLLEVTRKDLRIFIFGTGHSRLLLESGFEPPTFTSCNIAGAAQHNQALLDQWHPRSIHL